MENKIYAELLAQGNYIRVSKRLIATLGLEMAVFLSFLIDKYEYHSSRGMLKEGYFYITDNDVLLFTGLKPNTILNLKKKGKTKKLFSLKKLGTPAKTYYQINFEKINEFFLEKKTIEEISYERIFNKKISEESICYENLKKLSKKELQLLCKKNNVKYFGNFRKEKLIASILEKNEKVKSEDIPNCDNFEDKNFKELRIICKKIGVSYSGKDNKDKLINKVREKINKEKGVSNSVTNIFSNKCSKKSITSYQENWNNQKQIVKSDKQEQNHNHSDDEVNEFKNLFKELKVNFTLKNKNSIKTLLAKMSKEEVIDYLKETFNNLSNNPNVNNIPALFSEKISKGEKQEPFFEKELSEDKKEWLNRYSGIINNIILKKEVENIILDIPLAMLEKERNILGRMSIFDFKNHLYQLRQSINR